MGIFQQSSEDSRIWLLLAVPPTKNQSKLRSNSFQVRGPEVFNSLPKDLRETKNSMETYKLKLDMYLNLIPDKPRIGKGSLMYSNNLDSAKNEF